MDINYKTLDLLAEVFDFDGSNILGSDFYNNILLHLKNKMEYIFSGIYFLDDTCLSKKAQVQNIANINFNKDFDIFCNDKNIELLKFLNSKNQKSFAVKYNEITEYLDGDAFLNCDFLFSKLLIKNSFFGFCVFIRKKEFSADDISFVNLYLSIYSYLIKDFELNKVFKMQLSLLQEAISDKESAYKTIEKQNKKLIQADNAKTGFLANVSHELRTPLNAIIGFSDVLLADVFGQLNEKQKEYIKDINLSSIHLMGLINSLLDFSKIESGAVKLNMSEFSPELAINEVIKLLSSLIDAKEINLIFDNGFTSSIFADYQKFQQILFNLIGNAIKFSKQKGKIVVKTTQEGEYFILEVKDSGIGIEKKYHNFIFKKFTQIDNIYTKTGASTGLGLAIVKEYVKLHKGKIYVVSEPGKGSTFVVKLKCKTGYQSKSKK